MKAKLAVSLLALSCCSMLNAGGACPGDVNGDQNRDIQDVLEVLNNWSCAGDTCGGDANGDGLVDFQDLLEVLTNWGPCDATGGCVSHADCDDGDACTIDFCIGGQCFHIPMQGPNCN